MGDTSHLLPHRASASLLPGAATPSGLTPNTRTEAEAALSLNALAQTESAAPTTPLVDGADDGLDEATKAYRRPAGPVRASSTNYMEALMKVHAESSVSSAMSTDTDATSAENITDARMVASPPPNVTSTTITNAPIPPPGQGVVPLHSGVGSGQAQAVKKARSRGLSLGSLGRQQSWSEQDMKHIYSQGLLGKVDGDAGYGSGPERP